MFSGLWLVIGFLKPRYSQTIHPGGSFAPSTASTLFALFAKTIEISSVTVFATFLGQVLTRRSMGARDVRLADMAMRIWIVQPGFILTHWCNVKYAGCTILGTLSLLATISALLFTTASDALVSPHLLYGNWENFPMLGLVKESFANLKFLSSTCQTPIPSTVDPESPGLVCTRLMFVDLSMHDFNAYLQKWTAVPRAGQGSSNLLSRKQATSSILVEATIQGSWVKIDDSNVNTTYQKYGRIINNITLSMPHIGIYYATQLRTNSIIQPTDETGLGEYALRASVASPSTNVLCANIQKTELAPLVYVEFPDAKLLNSSSTTNGLKNQKMPVPNYANDIQSVPGKPYLNSTAVDDIFEWGAAYERMPPVFRW